MIERSYRIEQGEFGTKRIVQHGRCSGDVETISIIEAALTTAYELVQWPASRGVTLKALDGVDPLVVEIEPSTIVGRKYRCVKIGCVIRPLAAQQPGGAFNGLSVHEYEIIWQQVGALP